MTLEKEEIVLPEFIKEDLFLEYVKMRKKIKKPATLFALKLIIKKLSSLKEQGEDINAVLEQSIVNSWQGVFPVRQDKNSKEIPDWMKNPEEKQSWEQTD